VLFAKTTDRPGWSPSTIEEVTPEIISRFFDADSSFLKEVPSLSLPEELTSGTIPNNLTKYALPTEEEIGSVVLGSHATGGGLGVRFDELLARFTELRPGKMGVKEKVVEVVQRRCGVTDNRDGNWVWLKWIHTK
jgi:3-hydroxyisobutyryl-CoA hydrolase